MRKILKWFAIGLPVLILLVLGGGYLYLRGLTSAEKRLFELPNRQVF